MDLKCFPSKLCHAYETENSRQTVYVNHIYVIHIIQHFVFAKETRCTAISEFKSYHRKTWIKLAL